MADKNGPGNGQVIRGHFGAPRRRPKTLARLNAQGVQSRQDELKDALATGTQAQFTGFVFRATEIWGRTSVENRAAAEELLIQFLRSGKTVEDIAWDFVCTPEEMQREYPAHTAAIARAFLILAYGSETAH